MYAIEYASYIYIIYNNYIENSLQSPSKFRIRQFYVGLVDSPKNAS